MTYKALNEAESLIADLKFESAFELLKSVIDSNHTAEANMLAEVYNLQGTIVAGFAPYLTEYKDDDTGMAYFQKAIDINPTCLSATCNIVGLYTSDSRRTPYLDKNISSFVKAYEYLKSIENKLDENAKFNFSKASDSYHEITKLSCPHFGHSIFD